MIKVRRTPTAPASLAIEKAKPSGTYRQKDVVDQLISDFNGKCYLCEIKPVQDLQIEHLLPHHGGSDRDRMFDWNNLFFCCAHCNSVKNQQRYEKDIIDCCVVDPEILISQQLIDGSPTVTALRPSPEAENTACLITECFDSKNPEIGIRTYQCKIRLDELKKTMSIFIKKLDEYKHDQSMNTYRALCGMLERKHKFSGFMRTYIRVHQVDYPELFSSLDA